jgi:hypothetical protein
VIASTVPLRAARYLRVSTARQAEHDVSIPDQKRQGEAYCKARNLQLVETFIEPSASATNDRRPEFQRMIEAGTSKPAPFDVVVVHSLRVHPLLRALGRNSYDNALAETIKGLYKAEVIHRRGPWRNFEAVEFATLEWIDWFNHRRLLEPIGNIPSAEAEERYYAMPDKPAMAA